MTQEKIKHYFKYGGDVDGYVRFNGDIPTILFEEEDWALIDNLRQDFYLINNNLVSKEFMHEAEIRVKENCDSIETVALLKALIVTSNTK
ncbi:MAG: hypothetical protein V4615_13775 [Bacteroidota bacterium]